ncbi:hypothetical protein F511_36738 [Dorcoceras hygrometricum]|uniref:CCHC-type domain-containing protein n=1 Tax=Dorcoceras hygrometricum TaxID=472368 RepID=A0A2Z7CJC7_9LAMI|nr:hypothetical protein F511_36738 [Dorcoceras hygrometricum]
MSLFVKKFGKYLRRSYNPSSPYNNFHKSDKVSYDMKCYNCDHPVHFAADCNRPRKEDISRDDKRSDDRYRRDDKKENRYKREDKTEERTVERSKERSKDRRMRMRGDKRPSRKHDRKVLVAEESTKSWADTDSESSSSSSSSSDSEHEEVHCLMVDQTSDDEVFNFSKVEFTREFLVSALNDMVKEYRKLSQSFEEAKAENISLKSSSIESSSDELEDIDNLKIELSKLTVENDLLRKNPVRSKAEVDKLTKEMSSWNQSARALHKLHEIQKSVYDKTGLGYSSGESSEGETSTQSQSAYDKFNKNSFVKANVIYDFFESITFDDQNTPKLSDNGKAGIGFQRPENSKPSWLKNKLDKDKAKAGSKSHHNTQLWKLCRSADEGILLPVVDLIKEFLPRPTVKSQMPCEFGWSQAPRRQQDNPIVIDLTNVDQPKDQIASSVPAAGGVATNDQPADVQSVFAPTNVDKQDVAQAVASTSPLISRQTPEAPAGITNYQLFSPPAGNQGARTSYHSVLRPTAGKSVARSPADEPVASTSHQLEADAQANNAQHLLASADSLANQPATQGEQITYPIGLDLR